MNEISDRLLHLGLIDIIARRYLVVVQYGGKTPPR